MKIFVHNRQTSRRPNARKLATLARFFMLQAGLPTIALAQAGHLKSECPWAEVSLVLTDDAGIAPVNRTFLDHARATDVITFTLSPMPGGGAGTCGEIHLNVERALEEGARRGNATDELALYLAHGCDHLTGANDRTVMEQRRMRRRELLWIKRARRDGLMAGLWAEK
ncbi:MAG: rRNA maturation RNase YbeY [Verrucomicrobia bacterium]|nr:rRNA maturation RNase YbeY [Verrucomicrobiota bacterium]